MKTTTMIAATTAFLLLGSVVVVDAEGDKAETITVTSPVRSVSRFLMYTHSVSQIQQHSSIVVENQPVSPSLLLLEYSCIID